MHIVEPFEDCSDVLMFHSLTIHQGRDNVTADTIRLSTSARYQPEAEPVDKLALGPQRRWAEWEELFADWAPDDPLKHYWQPYPSMCGASPSDKRPIRANRAFPVPGSIGCVR